MPAAAQISSFAHIVVVVQENRTPDNLFYALCLQSPTLCSTTDHAKYDIQTNRWNARYGRLVQPMPEPLNNDYDLGHRHADFLTLCDLRSGGQICRMDGATRNAFYYVDNSKGLITPYLVLAQRYGWANFMFQTNQGPSFPAHQFLFAATSAPTAAEDAAGIFASENYDGSGCISGKVGKVRLINSNGQEPPDFTTYPCFNHDSLADELEERGATWRYYASTAGFPGLWDAPLAINNICLPDPDHRACNPGSRFFHDVDATNPSDFFKDVAYPGCGLKGVTWITPSGANSDHAGSNKGGGPSWVASIVNAIGESQCGFWHNTAIVVLWDDWGGWYDHEPPTFLEFPEGGYQMGFRVPMIFVSAYTAPRTIVNDRLDFGSIARFIEENFGTDSLGFADSRAQNDLRSFYNLAAPEHAFIHIQSPKNIEWFIHDRSPVTAPDDD